MNPDHISAARLANQQIVNPSGNSPKEAAHRLGAMQAQSYKWVKWAIGVRLPGSTLGTVEKAIAEADIIRTHLLRPTWHVVSIDDLRWMLELTAPRIKMAMRSRHKQLGLTDEVISKIHKIIEKALAEKDFLTRKELVGRLEEAGYENKNNLFSHLLMRAELDGVICSGPTEGKNHTYALFEKRAPAYAPHSKEESLRRLAEIYFTGHGPATIGDFVWWSGLTKTSARKAMKMIEPVFEQKEVDSKTYWFKPSPVKSTEKAYLLPAYDEFIVGYTDRSAVLINEHHKKVISINGIFKPVIVVNGKAAGIWKRTINKKSVSVKTQFFQTPSDEIKQKAEQAAKRFAEFLGKELKVEHRVLNAEA